MKKDNTRAYIALALVSFFWGTTYIAARISAQEIPGLFLAGLRQIISGLIMVSYFKARGYQWPKKNELFIITIQAIFLLCISNGLLTWAMQYITSGLAAIIAGLVPLFVALFSIILLQYARFTLKMFFGLIIGFVGIATIFYEHINKLFGSEFSFGIMLSVIATISWAFGTVYSSKNKLNTPILFSVGLQMLIAGMIVLPICFATGKYVDLNTVSTDAILGLAYLVVIGSLVAYSAYGFMITKLPPTQAAVYAYINPIVAVVCGWMLLNETITGNIITGTIITLIGVYLVNREFRKQRT